MSGSDSGPGQREVAYRLFAAEFDDAELSYSESDEERAPNYVVTPTGARVNRLFAVGVLTELEDVNAEMVRGRIVDPTGAFVTYAGQYQPDALAFLERIDPPAFLALSGKARTYEPEDGDRIYTSVRPESVSEVDADTRDRWIVTAAERTLERIGVMAAAIDSGLVGDQLRAALADAGVDERLADGVALALDHYGTTPAYLGELRELAIDAVEVVAGQREEVGRLDLAPGDGAGDASALSTLDLSDAPSPGTATGADATGSADEGGTETAGASETDSVSDRSATAETDVDSEETGRDELDSESATAQGSPIESESATETESASEPELENETTDISDASEESEEPEGVDTSDESSDEFDPDEFDPSEFELDEEERQEVEEEFGTEFSTAGEVEPAETGAEDADLGDDSEAASTADGAADETDATAAEAAEEPADSSEAPPDQEADEAEPVDLEDAVMDAMEDLDDGDGADRDELVAAVVDEYGASAEDVEGAIQDALMGGRCYEPSDGTLKSI